MEVLTRIAVRGCVCVCVNTKLFSLFDLGSSESNRKYFYRLTQCQTVENHKSVEVNRRSSCCMFTTSETSDCLEQEDTESSTSCFKSSFLCKNKKKHVADRNRNITFTAQLPSTCQFTHLFTHLCFRQNNRNQSIEISKMGPFQRSRPLI